MPWCSGSRSDAGAALATVAVESTALAVPAQPDREGAGPLGAVPGRSARDVETEARRPATALLFHEGFGETNGPSTFISRRDRRSNSPVPGLLCRFSRRGEAGRRCAPHGLPPPGAPFRPHHH